jgi:hypothetical protein
MPIDTAEAIALAVEAEQLVEFIAKALKPDGQGNKRLDKAEVRELLQRLGVFAAHVARDYVD